MEIRRTIYSVFNPQPANFGRLFFNNGKPYPYVTSQLIGPPYNLNNCQISHPFDCLILRYKDLFIFLNFKLATMMDWDPFSTLLDEVFKQKISNKPKCSKFDAEQHFQ